MRHIIQKTAPYTHRSGEIYHQALPHRSAPPPLPINERSVGFASALSHPLFVGEELAPPVAPNTAIITTVAKSQPPLAPHHVLASLVKWRWLDGKAQTVVLLRFNCDTSAFLFTKLLCRQDGRIALHPPSLSIPTTFSKAHQPLRPTPCPRLPCQREVA